MTQRLQATILTLLGMALVIVGGCASGIPAASSSPQPSDPAATWPEPVDPVSLQRAGPENPAPRAALDVAVLIFDTGLEDLKAAEIDTVFAEVRKAESLFMPVQLREALEQSGYWGVVRVLPERSDSFALHVAGKIVHADGRDMVIDVTATDASGREWLSRRYRGRAPASAYPVNAKAEPFAAVYHQVANDLAQALAQRKPARLATLQDIAFMRFAARLAPAAFADYLERTENGEWRLAGFPAESDSMLQRVRRLQRQENLFVDTVDEQYRGLIEEFAPTYHLWREYSRELVVYEEDYLARASQREIQSRRGTFAAMQQTYNTFRRAKVHEQDLYELATGFDNEVTATVVDVDDRVYRLRGSLQEQFVEWRRLLERIFTLETRPQP